jgi:hypothetical protein
MVVIPYNNSVETIPPGFERKPDQLTQPAGWFYLIK